MENLTTVTGKSEQEIKSLYLGAIDMLMGYGATEVEARDMVKGSFKDALGL